MELLSDLLAVGGITVIFFIIVLSILVPILALVDIVKSDFEGNNKLMWVLIVVFVNLFGALLYIFIGRKQKIRY